MMTVLIVDDTDSAREVAEKILRFYGVNTIGARSADEAFAILQAVDPNLILLDIAMPEVDGLTVLERLRNEPKWRTIPVVMMTAVADDESVKRAFRLGASEYLVKSAFTATRMLETVKRHARAD